MAKARQTVEEPVTVPAPIPEPVPVVPAWDVGDRIVVAVWRPYSNPRPGEAPGTWSTLPGRVISVNRAGTLVCYETPSSAPEEDDTPYGSHLRWSPVEYVFHDHDTADTVIRTLKPPA